MRSVVELIWEYRFLNFSILKASPFLINHNPFLNLQSEKTSVICTVGKKILKALCQNKIAVFRLLSGKKNLISLSAPFCESDPWTAFL